MRGKFPTMQNYANIETSLPSSAVPAKGMYYTFYNLTRVMETEEFYGSNSSEAFKAYCKNNDYKFIGTSDMEICGKPWDIYICQRSGSTSSMNIYCVHESRSDDMIDSTV